jgi:CRISPR-associated Csx14 family protein
MNVLISSLGESPAVVTETVDALEREERVQIDQVVTIGTSDWAVDLSRQALEEEFARSEGRRVHYVPDRVEAQELLTEDDHVNYLNRVATWLRSYQGQDVHLSLSGGRKTMSAVMAIAAQIYGAKTLCHAIPLDKELEQLGEVRTWSSLPREKQQYVLHPPADKVRLVRLPLVSLFPLLDDILRALQGQTDANPQAVQLLESSRLMQREKAQMKLTHSGEQLLSVLSDIEQLPSPSPLRPDQKQVAVPDHGYGGKRLKVETFAKRLVQFPWTVSVRTIPYGNKPRTGIREIYDDGRIEIDVRTGEFSAGLEVRTTAQTKGQAERVARELEKFLR